MFDSAAANFLIQVQLTERTSAMTYYLAGTYTRNTMVNYGGHDGGRLFKIALAKTVFEYRELGCNKAPSVLRAATICETHTKATV